MHSPVHILSGDITLHKRTLEPIKTLIYGLRRYDLDRSAALVDSAKINPATGAPIKVNVEGYMSKKSIIYLVCLCLTVRSHWWVIFTTVLCSFKTGRRYGPYGTCIDLSGYVWRHCREPDQLYFQREFFQH